MLNLQDKMNAFAGFHEPESNWSKLPHEFIEAFPLIETLGEAKVILYILRHTWGYGDEEKRITMDEFVHGRKRRNGTRIDRGTGLSAPTIRAGLAQAVTHGFIVIHTDDSDLARIKHYFSLRSFQRERSLPSKSDGKILSPTPQESFPHEKESFQPEKDSLQRTEKETIRKIPLKETPEIVSTADAQKESDATVLWTRALAELKLTLTKATFDTWLLRTEAVSYQNGAQPPVLTVSTRNPYGLQWLDQRLRGNIERVVNHLAGKTVEIQFTLKAHAD